ncbi:MAG: efflux RND transporter periplasmic adaptor subunit [Lachnospiraceae bacterium]|nr:efflux RND transporter periplasmic adaptor subunit [Lachnospiraceae bacterium]
MFKRKKKQNELEETSVEMTAVTKKKKRVKKRYILLAIVLVLIVISVINNKRAANLPVEVKISTIEYGDMTQTLDTSGIVESEEIKSYFAGTSAQIKELNVEAGSVVKAGDRLVEYNVEKLELAAKQTELETKASDYGIDAAVTALNYSQSKSYEAAKDYDEAVKYVNHYSGLVAKIKEDLVSASKAAEDVNTLTAQLAQAQKELDAKPNSEKRQSKVKELTKSLKAANKEAAKYDVAALQASLETCSADLAAYESQKAQYEIQKEADPSIASQKSQQSVLKEVNQLAKQQTRESLEDARRGVCADFDGIVTSVGCVEGQTVMEGSELLALASDKKVKVTIDVSKYDLEKIAPDQKAVVTINGREYEGHVDKIDRVAHLNQSGASVLSADIHIDNPDDNIYLGIEGKISIETATAEHALLVPVECINSDAKGDFCYVVKDGELVRKDVELGITSVEYYQILSGLEEGDQVVKEVTGEMTEGMKVTPVAEQTEEDKEEPQA